MLEMLFRYAGDYNFDIKDYNVPKGLNTAEEIAMITEEYGQAPYIIFGADNILGALDPDGWKLSDEKIIDLFNNNTFVISCSENQDDPRGACESVREEYLEAQKRLKFAGEVIPFSVDSKFSEISSSAIIRTLGKLLPQELMYITENKLVNKIPTIAGLVTKTKKTKKNNNRQ